MEELKTRKQKDEPKGFAGTVYTLAHDLLYVLAIITVLFVFFARLTGVNGRSMQPTLYGVEDDGSGSGDYLILLSNVLCPNYQQGDIVVACVPSFQNSKPIVKRVVATPGQRVELVPETDEFGEPVQDARGTVCHVYVDGVLQDESRIKNQQMHGGASLWMLGDNEYFLMGDNRDNSSDSRVIGPVDRQYIVGKALTIVLPGGENGRDWSRLFKLS